MILVDEMEIKENTDKVSSFYKSGANAPLRYYDFVKKIFPVLEKQVGRTYPYEVKIPKPIDQLLAGDLTPERIITVEEPFKCRDSDIWFGSTMKGVTLRAGYENGNSKFPCTNTLGDGDVHCVMAGATGQGKSVTLNAIIFGMIREYAPWEVQLTLADPKIVEFKTLAKIAPVPHFRAIAATEDTDYIVSVLLAIVKEMNTMNSVYNNTGAKDIETFRKMTGLAIPQNIIVCDEFQTLFANAKSSAQKKALEYVVGKFIRLGRNTGYHLILASQELSNDVSQDLWSNVKLRGALGCSASVSEKILGNDGAKEYYGKKGYLVFNNNAVNKQKTDNHTFRVPFLEPDTLKFYGQELIQTAKDIQYKYELSFYDEKSVVREKDYAEYIHGFGCGPNKICLGMPSYMKEGEQIISLPLNGSDIENFFVLSQSKESLARLYKMLYYNFKASDNQNVVHGVVCPDSELVNECRPAELTSNLDDSKSFVDNLEIDTAAFTIKIRQFMLQIDKLAFSNPKSNDVSDELLEIAIKDSEEYNTPVFKARMFYTIKLLNESDTFMKAFDTKIKTESQRKEVALSLFFSMMSAYKQFNAMNTMIEKGNFTPYFVWILGVSRLVGIGRDPKNQYLDQLKGSMSDGTEVGVRYILFGNSLDEVIYALRPCIRWYLCENIAASDISRMKCPEDEGYPNNLSSVLDVVYDSVNTILPERKVVKFKKMYFDNEILT